MFNLLSYPIYYLSQRHVTYPIGAAQLLGRSCLPTLQPTPTANLLTRTKVYLLSYPILRSRRALEAAHSRGPVTTVLPLTVSL
jgi:hypothetical protein